MLQGPVNRLKSPEHQVSVRADAEMLDENLLQRAA
jgi:hypothetical protein